MNEQMTKQTPSVSYSFYSAYLDIDKIFQKYVDAKVIVVNNDIWVHSRYAELFYEQIHHELIPTSSPMEHIKVIAPLEEILDIINATTKYDVQIYS